jgi:hypothetical protein
MSQQILSQDEVDALLQGITGESQKLEQAEEQAGGIREYNLANQERIVRGRMPTMEIINERCARLLRLRLRPRPASGAQRRPTHRKCFSRSAYCEKYCRVPGASVRAHTWQ